MSNVVGCESFRLGMAICWQRYLDQGFFQRCVLGLRGRVILVAWGAPHVRASWFPRVRSASGPRGRWWTHVTTEKDGCFHSPAVFCGDCLFSPPQNTMVSWRKTRFHLSGCCPCTCGRLPHLTSDFSRVCVPSPIHHTLFFRARKVPALHHHPLSVDVTIAG